MEAKKNKLVIIGNGFDLAHKFKTSYKVSPQLTPSFNTSIDLRPLSKIKYTHDWEMRSKLVLRQFWWKVFAKVILENKFSSKTCQFSNEKGIRGFKHLRFYGSNNLSPKLTKNQFHRNTHTHRCRPFKPPPLTVLTYLVNHYWAN